jgi:asparagine synthase (glutamine-hydrolysing)
MCGIYGIWQLDGKPLDLTALEWATTRLRHRGPDDEGYLLVDPQNQHAQLCGGRDTTPALNLPRLETFRGEPFSFGFGFRRLAILDLSPAGHQPMSSPDGRFWLVFNGEIYNYLELRHELSTQGYTFHTGTDSEVILAAYQAWGRECLSRFNGMWGMAIWDFQERSLFLARDRFGVKPLYYTAESGHFAFGSEIKALVGVKGIPFRPNDEAIYHYLSRGQVPESRSGNTFFLGVYSLPPGQALLVSQEGVRVYRYWDLGHQDEPMNQPFERLLEEYRALFEDSVRLRLRSDVAVGTCLSGGIDSSAIVCTINRLMTQQGFTSEQIGQQQRTFSAVYEMQGPFNERIYIDKVLESTGAQGNFTWPTADRLQREAEQMVWHQDEPFQSTSIFAQWCVMSKVRERGVTVLLDGQGADEILGGYRPYNQYLGDLLRKGRYLTALQESRAISENTNTKGWRFLLPALAKQLGLPLPESRKKANQFRHMNRQALAPELFEAGLAWEQSSSSELQFRDDRRLLGKTGLNLDEHLREILESSSLPLLLRYEDRNSMAYAIEARVPFLDYRFVQYNFGPAAPWRIHQGWTKYILRQAMQPMVPAEILWRKDKIGFGTPEQAWLADWVRHAPTLFSEDWLSSDYLSLPRVHAQVNHWLDQGSVMPPVWLWVNLELWLRVWQQA